MDSNTPSFQSPTDLFFVIDYKSGGELFSHLQKDGGRFEEHKVRFYLCEIILALQYLHDANVIYRFVDVLSSSRTCGLTELDILPGISSRKTVFWMARGTASSSTLDFPSCSSRLTTARTRSAERQRSWLLVRPTDPFLDRICSSCFMARSPRGPDGRWIQLPLRLV